MWVCVLRFTFRNRVKPQSFQLNHPEVHHKHLGSEKQEINHFSFLCWTGFLCGEFFSVWTLMNFNIKASENQQAGPVVQDPLELVVMDQKY